MDGLLSAGLVESASVLGAAAFKIQATLGRARAAATGHEHRRAVRLYEQALYHLSKAATTSSGPTPEQAAKWKQEALIGLAGSLDTLQLADTAIKKLEDAYRSYADMPVPVLVKLVAIRAHSPSAALVAPLTELIKKQPLALEAYLLLQRTSKSATAWTQLLGEHAGQLPPGFAELVHAYGRKHAGDDIGAMTAFQQLNTAFPNNVEILLPWAECAMQAGRWTAARNIYGQVRRIDPYIVRGMDRYVAVLLYQSDFVTARQITEVVFMDDTRRPEPWVCMARIVAATGKPTHAVPLAEKAAALGPDYGYAHFTLAHIRLEAQQLEQLADQDELIWTAIQRAHQLEPAAATTLDFIVQLRLRAGQVREALDMATEAAKLSGNAPTQLATLASVYSQSSRHKSKAVALYERALSQQVDHPLALFGLARYYVENDEVNKAIELMQQYEAHHPTEAFHIMLGKLYHKANDTARAIDHFRSAQRVGCVTSLNPHSTIAAKALEAIEAAMNPAETANLDQSEVQ